MTAALRRPPTRLLLTRRSLAALAAGAVAGTLLMCGVAAGPALAGAPAEIRVDWATYNPVSIVLKDKKFLEDAFAKDGIAIRWVQSAGSNKALEFLNAGSLDFGSTEIGRAHV